MNGHHRTLLDDLDEALVDAAPVGHLLSGGHAMKRRKQRAFVAGAAAVSALVIGGSALAFQGVPGSSDDRNSNEPLIADSAAPDLAVEAVIGVSEPLAAAIDGQVGKVSIWNPESRTLAFVPDARYGSGCLPLGTAKFTNSGAVALTVQSDLTPDVCGTDIQSTTLTIDGLTTVPSELTVTVSGETFTVPVLNAPTPTNAFEDADKTDPLTSERLAWQVSTQGYRTELMGAAARTKGWAGGAIDWPSRTLVLYSSSESPTAEIEAIISRHPDDMAVRWEAVDYSEQELEVAQRALYAAIPGALGGSYLRDFSGVIVRIRQVVLDDPQKVAALRRLAEEATTVPVVFQVGTLAFAG